MAFCHSSGGKSLASHRCGPGSMPRQIFSEYFGFTYQISFHRLLHTHHHLSSFGNGILGQIVTDVTSGLSLAPEPYRLRQFHRQRMEPVISRIRNGCELLTNNNRATWQLRHMNETQHTDREVTRWQPFVASMTCMQSRAAVTFLRSPSSLPLVMTILCLVY
jgi:hypothetical protein